MRETSLDIGKPFRGYVATYWSEAVNRVDATGTAAVNPTFRYIHAREYFRNRYGNNFSETDHWRFGIPTFEEYGQWVSRQAQLFTQSLLVDERTRAALKLLTFLRLYKVDVELMRALGIRFLITDSMFPGIRHLTLRATEARPGAISVNLFELDSANLGTYSPTHQLEAAPQGDVLSRIAAKRPDLESAVFVAKRVPGPPLLPARNVRRILERDGYRVAARWGLSAHRGRTGFPGSASAHRRGAAGAAREDHRAAHEGTDPTGLPGGRGGHELPRRARSR